MVNLSAIQMVKPAIFTSRCQDVDHLIILSYLPCLVLTRRCKIVRTKTNRFRHFGTNSCPPRRLELDTHTAAAVVRLPAKRRLNLNIMPSNLFVAGQFSFPHPNLGHSIHPEKVHYSVVITDEHDRWTSLLSIKVYGDSVAFICSPSVNCPG